MLPSQRPETREGVCRVVLVEADDGRCHLSLEALRGQLEGAVVGLASGDRFLDPLQERAEDEPIGDPTALGPSPESSVLRNRPELLDGRRRLRRRDEEGPAGRQVRMEERFGLECRGGVRVARLGLPPFALGSSPVARRSEREPEVEPRHPASGMQFDESPQALEAPLRPGGEGCPDGSLDGRRVVAEDSSELPQGGLALPPLVFPLGEDELTRIGLARESAQLKGWGRRRGLGPAAIALEEGTGDHRGHDEDGRGGHETYDSGPGRHRSSVPAP